MKTGPESKSWKPGPGSSAARGDQASGGRVFRLMVVLQSLANGGNGTLTSVQHLN